MLRIPTSAFRIGTRARHRVPPVSLNLYFIGLIAVVSVYYLFLLSNGTLQMLAPELLDKVFDNMLVHLLHGEFTVDREAIDYEAVTQDGKTYSYFAVFPAILRLLAMPFVDIAQADLARLSCLMAVVIFVVLQLRTLLIVHYSLPAGSRIRSLFNVMVAATVLSGPQLYILGSAWVYHEPILWAAVLAAVFNLVVIRTALSGDGFRTSDLALLAALAGLAINTRAPIGVALYLGTVLLIAWAAWSRLAPERTEWRWPASGRVLLRAASALARDPRISLPVLVLGLLAVAAGIVNFGRWGNPFAFGGVNHSYWIERHPNVMIAVRDYGLFNLDRIGIAVLYYATGIPYILKSAPSFAGFLRCCVIEAPPLTPLLTNPLTVLLAGVGLYRLWWRPDLRPRSLAMLRIALIGHASAVVLILAFFTFTLRYRFDFAPFMTLAAFVGYRSLSMTAANFSGTWRRQILIAAVGLCVLGVLGSHYILLVHKVWSIGVPMDVRLALFPFAPFAHASFEP
jgi:hypothetical protein